MPIPVCGPGSWRRTMLTQIYEVARPAEAEAISSIRVDHVCVLVGDGSFPRSFRFTKQLPL